MSSAYYGVTERNIRVKFNENRSKGLRDMKVLRNGGMTDGLTDEEHSYNPIPFLAKDY